MPSAAQIADDPLVFLSDEFDDAATLPAWKRLHVTEGWGFDQLELWDIHSANAGQMTVVPYASSWFNEWRGVHVYKPVRGDFVVTTRVTPRNRALTGPPGVAFSLAGVFVRTPRPEIQNGASDWTAGGQNYLFLSLGSADQPGSYQFEVKTTVDSESTLEISPGAPSALIQIARIGDVFIALRQLENGDWEVHRRYGRPDMPDLLHVGLTTYTDWPTVSAVGFSYHNENQLSGVPPLPGGVIPNPDLVARFDYVRYRIPRLPEALQGADLLDPAEVSDEELLGFLGGHANAPAIIPFPLLEGVSSEGNLVLTAIDLAGRDLTLQWSHDLIDWQDDVQFQSSGEPQEFLRELPDGVLRRHFRVSRSSSP